MDTVGMDLTRCLVYALMGWLFGSVSGGTSSPLSFRRISDTHGHFLRFPFRLSSTSPAPHESTSGALSPVSVTDGPSKVPVPQLAQESVQLTTSDVEAERQTRLSKGCSSSFETDEKSSVEEDELTEEALQSWSKEVSTDDLIVLS